MVSCPLCLECEACLALHGFHMCAFIPWGTVSQRRFQRNSAPLGENLFSVRFKDKYWQEVGYDFFATLVNSRTQRMPGNMYIYHSHSTEPAIWSAGGGVFAERVLRTVPSHNADPNLPSWNYKEPLRNQHTLDSTIASRLEAFPIRSQSLTSNISFRSHSFARSPHSRVCGSQSFRLTPW